MADPTAAIGVYVEAFLADIDSKLAYLVDGRVKLEARTDGVLGHLGGMDDHLEGIELRLESVAGQLNRLERRLDKGVPGQQGTPTPGARSRGAT
jgi:hypothetical protein